MRRAANLNGSVSVFLGNGSGSFGAVTNFTVSLQSVSVTAGDFNGDGKADIASSNQQNNYISVLLNCASLGMPIYSNGSEVSIYPNPSSDKINVRSSSTLNNIVVFNSLGEKVLEMESKNIEEQIDVSNLPNGIYSVKTQDKNIRLIKG